MTFNWKTAMAYLRHGRKVRKESWEKGKFLVVHNACLVDQDMEEVSYKNLNDFADYLYWGEYLETLHGLGRFNEHIF